MIARHDFFNRLDRWSDEMPNISNETAYVLSAFLEELCCWAENRFHAQVIAYANDLLSHPRKLNPLWGVDNDDDSNDQEWLYDGE